MTTQEREFELAVRSYSNDMYRFSFWLCRDHHVAEDLVQEAFQRAWLHWGKLNDAVTLKKWLFSILRNEFLRRFERKQIDTVDMDEVEIPIAGGLGLDEAYGLRQMLMNTPVSLREPLLLQVLGGYSAEELAELYQTSTGAVTTRLSRARQWLRNQLHQDQQEFSPTLSKMEQLL